MRPLLTLALSGAMALPAAAVAQEVPPADPAPAPTPLVALPAPGDEPPVAPVEPEAAPVRAEVKPSLEGARPTTVAPVLVEGKDPPKDKKVGQKVGSVAGGVVGGLAGAAVAGPVGKIAGGLVGKRVAKALVGGGKDKKDAPQIRAAQTAPSADQAAAETAELAATPPLPEPAADPDSPTP
jgi:pyruvate dehydrogenase E2 component (dihydrolipoamide acetyltransferase)